MKQWMAFFKVWLTVAFGEVKQLLRAGHYSPRTMFNNVKVLTADILPPYKLAEFRAQYAEEVSGPGKFECEEPYTAYYWEHSMDGGTEEYGEVDGPVGWNGVMDLGPVDWYLWPDLTGYTAIVVHQSDSGFISSLPRTAAELEADIDFWERTMEDYDDDAEFWAEDDEDEDDEEEDEDFGDEYEPWELEDDDDRGYIVDKD